MRGDCRDEALIRPLVAKADVIIPLAALVGMPLCKVDTVGARTVNQEAVEMICRLASKAQRIIYPTTNSGYGIGEKGKFCTEETPLRPISLYGMTKSNAEAAVLAARQRGHLPAGHGVRRVAADAARPAGQPLRYPAVTDRDLVIFEGTSSATTSTSATSPALRSPSRTSSAMEGRPYNVGLEEANLSKEELAADQGPCAAIRLLDAPIGEDPDKRNYIVSNQRLRDAGSGRRGVSTGESAS